MIASKDLEALPAGAESLSALKDAAGGRLFEVRDLSAQDVVMLEHRGANFLYARVGPVDGKPDPASIGKLRKILRKDIPLEGRDLDHVASKDIEAKQLGFNWVLVAATLAGPNRSNGSTNERGVAPLRAFDAAAQANGVSRYIGTMQEKVSGLRSAGRGRSLHPRRPLNDVETRRALMLGRRDQAALLGLRGAELQAQPAPSPARPYTQKLARPLKLWSSEGRPGVTATTGVKPRAPTKPSAEPPAPPSPRATKAPSPVPRPRR